MYQQINLTDHTLIGAPSSIPAVFAGWTDAALADISAAVDPAPQGWAGQGLWPVIVTLPAAYDPRSQVVVDPASFTADVAARVVRGQQTTRPMTASELASANPPRTATAKQVRYALSDLGVRDAWEAAAAKGTVAMQDWWGWCDPIAEDATKLGRLCKAVGITPAALFDKAVVE